MIRRTNLKVLPVISILFLLLGWATASGGTIYVDTGAGGANNGSSWGDAYLYLQDGLAGASGGDDIWVAEGTYKPDANTANPSSGLRTDTFQLINGVEIYGGFPSGGGTRDPNANETILSGDINVSDVNTDNSYHIVVTGSGTDATAVLDGFTITAGNANGSAPHNRGGGMYNDSGSPTVVNCIFKSNSANDSGGGMFNNSGSPTVTNCTFSENEAIGLLGKGGGMFNVASNSTVTNCTFTGNKVIGDTGGGGGGMYNSFSSPTITNCIFSNNCAVPLGGGGFDPYGGGMYNAASSPTVTNCTFSGNWAGSKGGIYNSDSWPTVTNCIFWGNSGTEVYPSSINVTYCNVEGGYSGTGNINADPLFVRNPDPGTDGELGTGDDDYGDLRLSAGSPCIDSGDNNSVPADTADLDNDANTTERTPFDLDGKVRFFDDLATADTGVADLPDYPQVVDMGAYEYGVIIYVDESATGANDGTTWGNAYNYLADALTDADVSGDDIWVAAGTYKPDEGGGETPGDRMATFGLINGVAIYGGFPIGGGDWNSRDPNAYETILSGDLLGDDGPDFANNGENSYHVVTGSGTEPNAVLDGFTITKGNANGSWPKNEGGGMSNESGSPTVMNCTFSGNSANFGGGMSNMTSSSPTVTNCLFSGNSAVDWFGGGICNMTSSSPTVTNCTFSGNSADNNGGGMYNWDDSDPTITNCTFSGNSTTNYGGGMYNGFSSPTVTNCILWGNTASSGTQIYDDGMSSTTVSYSDVQGGWAGATNIAEDPLFKDADNLSLSFDSPCIDAGDNNSVPADTADLDNDANTTERTPLDLAGNARFTDDPVVVDTGNGTAPIVEMGAYERYEFCGSGVFPYPAHDVTGPDGVQDCRVDFYDFASFAAHWLEYTGPE